MLGAKQGASVRFRVGLSFAAALAALCGSAAGADDIGAAARGVVRVIAVNVSYANSDESSVSFGSGFAISPHHIVTNAHVVENTESSYGDSAVAVVPSEGTKPLRGTVIAYDPVRDLAIIDVGTTRLEPLAIYAGPVESGERTAALGYPGNVDIATANSIYDLIEPRAPVRAEGNISDQRTIDGKQALLHTAPISRGNSGGPLVDECGRVLGVNTYTALTDSGDAPFGFAVISQELMSFLRDHNEQFQQIGSACVTMAEQAQRDERQRDQANQEEANAEQQAAQERQRRLDAAKAAAQDSRENHAVGSALLGLLAAIAGAFAIALFLKECQRAAAASAAVAALSLTGGAISFFTRPSLDPDVPILATPASAAVAPVAGNLMCRVQSDRSRITVSSTDDLAMTWDASGCMNGRTQYVNEGSTWRRVLVPNGSETVFVQDFDPKKREYASTRYMLPQADMDRMRQLRGASGPKNCNSDPHTIQQLQLLTDQLVSSLPTAPNEKLIYRCEASQ
jgi:hypothetical protein